MRSVRSYFFRELVYDNSDARIAELKLSDLRIYWRWAGNKARAWCERQERLARFNERR